MENNRTVLGMENWLARAGRLGLGILAIGAASPVIQAVDPAKAYGNIVERIQPAKAKARHSGHDDPWVEFDNVPYGYYLGQFNTVTDQETVLATTKAEDYLYLAIRVRGGGKPYWECGWSKATTKAEVPSSKTADHSPCAKQLGKLASSRYVIGHDFNCPSGACDDGTNNTSQTAACNGVIYRNDKALDLATAGAPFSQTRKIKHPLQDPMGTISDAAKLHYRFRPNDYKAVTIRNNTFSWGEMAPNCIKGSPTGGPAKYSLSLSLKQEVAGVVG